MRGLVIGGMRIVHKKLKKLNVDLTLIHDKEKLKENDSEIYELIVGTDLNNFEKTIMIAESLNNIYHYDFIGAYHEHNQYLASIIAEKLNLDFHSKEVIETVYNKYKMRKKLSSTQFSLSYDLIKDKSDLEKINKYDKYILKPINSWGSIGIISNKNVENINWDESNQWLIEEFIDGEEFSIETLSYNGSHNVISITKKFINDNFIELGHIPFYPIPSKLEKSIRQSITNFLNIIGIKDGVTHTEIKLKNNKIYIIETHTRMGGDYIPELIEYSSDYDFIEAVSRISIGDYEHKKVTPKRNVAIWFTVSNKEGIIKNLEYLPTEFEDKIIEKKILKKKGDVVKVPSSSFDRIGYVIAQGDSKKEALKNAKIASENLQIEHEEE